MVGLTVSKESESVVPLSTDYLTLLSFYRIKSKEV